MRHNYVGYTWQGCRCEKCTEANRKHVREAAARQKAKGLCRQCTKKICATSKVFCEYHRLKHLKSWKRAEEKRKAKRRAAMPEPTVICKDCNVGFDNSPEYVTCAPFGDEAYRCYKCAFEKLLTAYMKIIESKKVLKNDPL